MKTDAVQQNNLLIEIIKNQVSPWYYDFNGRKSKIVQKIKEEIY